MGLDAQDQSELLVLLAKKSDAVRAVRMMSRVVTLVRWPEFLDSVAETWPEMVPAIADEFVSYARGMRMPLDISLRCGAGDREGGPSALT